MDFGSARRTAQKWISGSKTPFEIIDIDTEGTRIIFGSTITDETFYVVGPENERGKISWVRCVQS